MCVHPVVSRLAEIWKKNNTRIETTVFCLPQDMKGFIEKYDAVQQQLSSIAGMDDLLSGTYSICIVST